MAGDSTTSTRGGRARPCPQCGAAVPLHSPHTRIVGTRVQVYCSSGCVRDAAAGVRRAATVIALPPPRARSTGLKLAIIGLGLATASPLVGLLWPEPPTPAPSPDSSRAAAAAPPDAAPEMLGPAWPPTEKDWAVILADDVWVHPLPGPVRQMPIRDSRIFGADRGVGRPEECYDGHCGVDIGTTWGQPVFAVHDGTVERIKRVPTKGSGGKYVRLAHRDGTVLTGYFHLAAIPHHLREGKRVRAGDVIGLLGDTGVENSGAHLHFAISVIPGPGYAEQYIDPEPLIALWPLKNAADMPIVTNVEPGVPRGPKKFSKRKKRKKRAKPRRSRDDPAPSRQAEAPAPEASPDPGPGPGVAPFGIPMPAPAEGAAAQ